ncbi:MAG TPA: hypothetical protein VMW15_06965 [Terracidiphilus sp.]|nr:hypothetical protein [Terracidiphilus sp.]
MTLLDAPQFDAARERRNRMILSGSAGLVFVLIVGWWLVAGRPVDWPWNWNAHMFGRITVNHFLEAVEQNDLPKAYGIWMHDPSWQQHPAQYGAYPFSRFQQDWSRTSPDNEYGVIQSHKIAVARVYGNVLLLAVLINGRKSGALNLTYDPKTHTLNFSPPGESLYLGP